MPTLSLPGLDCGLCGYRTCDALRDALGSHPEHLARCVYRTPEKVFGQRKDAESQAPTGCSACPSSTSQAGVPSCAVASRRGAAAARPAARGSLHAVASEAEVEGSRDGAVTSIEPKCGCAGGAPTGTPGGASASLPWQDTLGRPFDFYLEHFPEDAGPREIIIPRNPMVVRELDVRVGDILLGRPLGMSCGCPITHCGVATQVDPRNGVLTWCVTGPLDTRQHGFKDLGYYSAEAYEGLVRDTRCDLRVGMRYFFQPRMCMLQWRHSGLMNYVNHTPQGVQVRLEGLWIG